jgi:uncharacterized protein YceH (UPF0502 family)
MAAEGGASVLGGTPGGGFPPAPADIPQAGEAWPQKGLTPPRLSSVVSVSNLQMSPEQLRVLGCLIEKQRTTPDAYPLSLNSLRLACNQSTNRDPVVDYDEAVIRDALHRLERKGLVRLASGAGSRASKYRHLLAEALPMQDGEQAVMCVLMLRGAQTPGELKQRTERMHRFGGLEDVGETLERLIERGLVARLDRRPGQKEERYEHLLGQEGEGEEEVRQGVSASVPDGGGGVGSARMGEGGAVPESGEGRLSRLEERVGRIEELAGRVGRLEALMSEMTGPEAQR